MRHVRVRLERDRRQAEAEITNLTAALAAGAGSLPSVVAALQAAEDRWQSISGQLARGTEPEVFTAQTAAKLERQVTEKLARWRASMRQDAPEARMVLRAVIAERLALTPTERDGQRSYRYRGTFSFGGLFEELVDVPQSMASPEGFEPSLPA
jgi:hypothetical protein